MESHAVTVGVLEQNGGRIRYTVLYMYYGIMSILALFISGYNIVGLSDWDYLLRRMCCGGYCHSF